MQLGLVDLESWRPRAKSSAQSAPSGVEQTKDAKRVRMSNKVDFRGPRICRLNVLSSTNSKVSGNSAIVGLVRSARGKIL